MTRGPDDEYEWVVGGGGPDADLQRAADGLQAELDRKTQRLRVIGSRCFTPTTPPGPEHERIADAIGDTGVVFLGDYGVDGGAGAVVRPGVLDEGLVLTLVVAPPQKRAPYLELTTFFTTGEALTTNGRTDEGSARPALLHLDRQPDLGPKALLERHRDKVRALEARGRVVRRFGLSGNRGTVFHAIDEYLTALGC